MKVNMNVEISKETLNLLYTEYSEYVFPALSIAISLMLILVFLLPQITSFSAKNTEKNTEVAKLNQLKSVNSLVSGTDVTLLDSNLSIASAALPTTKDFEAILSTLSSIGNDANVSILNYHFQDGNFSSQGNASRIPSLSFNMDLSASPAQTLDFINRIYQAFPLCEVTSITGADISSTISIQFFYKPFEPSGSGDMSVVKSLNPKETNALAQISKWSAAASITIINQAPVSSSGSGESNSPF